MTLLKRGRVVSLSNQSALPPLMPEVRALETQGRVVSDDLASAAQRAQRIVAQAEATAAARRAQFEQDAGRLRDEMRAQALADVELEHVRKTLDLAMMRQRIVAGAQQDVITIARLLAERILCEELTLRPERLVELAGQVLREARGARTITIYAAPQDAKYLSCEIEKLAPDSNACVNVLADDALGHGDLRVETDVGTIDGRIGTQLAHLASTILESIRS
jgi:flagellar biosynthesis/type III secretory pathway protein FliH